MKRINVVLVLVILTGCSRQQPLQQEVQPSPQTSPQTSTEPTVQSVSIDGLHTGMTWQEARATLSFKNAVCTNRGGNTVTERAETKSCIIRHESRDGEDESTGFMFYRDRLYYIRSGYKFKDQKAELRRVLGQPKRSPDAEQTFCWYRDGVSYRAEQEEGPPPSIIAVDFDVSPRSVQSQLQVKRDVDPVCWSTNDSR